MPILHIHTNTRIENQPHFLAQASTPLPSHWVNLNPM